jgi:hypothetical protein
MSGDGTDAGGGLASRISKPEPATKSWADEVNSPTEDTPPEISIDAMSSKPADSVEQIIEEKPEDIPQHDGAAEPFGGSQLQEPQYAVEIKLADMQADPNNPLYSAATFEQLGLYV